MKVITDAFMERQASPNNLISGHKDFLDYLIQEINDKDTILNQAVAADLVFVLLFATFETTSTSITMATKFLADNPAALGELAKEHQDILKNRSEQDTGITWKEYKSMTFTHMVINETLRLANIVPGIFRRVIKDVDLKGYTIPKGMIVMVSPSTVHLNPDKYQDPLTFNPWRWKGKELHMGSKDFMAFGGGVRLCVGADFAKLQLAVYLHYLVTKYRWKVTKGGDIVRKPGLMFPNGLHLEISESQN
ncbi:cytochrome P450 87A3 [Daucus carota subsp. sativus]|uniref:cytochrome P450 87A3 n=1 Tax=Daucus carota subsp. sativus TaxID=79200 RepID=UPI00308289D8